MTDTQLPKLPEPEGYADPAYGPYAALAVAQVRAYASEAVRAALAAQGEPVAWMATYVDALGNDYVYVTSHHDLAVENDMHGDPRPLYTAPPAPAKPMTDEEIIDAMRQSGWPEVLVKHVIGARTFTAELAKRAAGPRHGITDKGGA